VTSSGKLPLVLFHQNPRSAYEYTAMLEILAQDRLCIALDTPGYGDSAPPPGPPGIEGYAQALVQALEHLGFGNGKRFDAFGFHTGTFLAGEVAAQRPDMVRSLVLAGVPYTTGEEQAAYYQNLVVNRSSAPRSGSHMVDHWYSFVEGAPEKLGKERGRRLMLEHMVTGDNTWWGYHGVFTYATAERFALINQPVLLLAVEDLLKQNTIDTLDILENARLESMPVIDQQGYFLLLTHPEIFTEPTMRFLDGLQ
jgi:pimeloyl-ACP methyl ester carboxylesterase